MHGFYDEIKRQFCPGFDGFGRNLDALNDVLSGGFGVVGPRERFEVIWQHSEKSRQDLSAISDDSGKTIFEEILDVFARQRVNADGTPHLILYLR